MNTLVALLFLGVTYGQYGSYGFGGFGSNLGTTGTAGTPGMVGTPYASWNNGLTPVTMPYSPFNGPFNGPFNVPGNGGNSYGTSAALNFRQGSWVRGGNLAYGNALNWGMNGNAALGNMNMNMNWGYGTPSWGYGTTNLGYGTTNLGIGNWGSGSTVNWGGNNGNIGYGYANTGGGLWNGFTRAPMSVGPAPVSYNPYSWNMNSYNNGWNDGWNDYGTYEMVYSPRMVYRPSVSYDAYIPNLSYGAYNMGNVFVPTCGEGEVMDQTTNKCLAVSCASPTACPTGLKCVPNKSVCCTLHCPQYTCNAPAQCVPAKSTNKKKTTPTKKPTKKQTTKPPTAAVSYCTEVPFQIRSVLYPTECLDASKSSVTLEKCNSGASQLFYGNYPKPKTAAKNGKCVGKNFKLIDCDDKGSWAARRIQDRKLGSVLNFGFGSSSSYLYVKASKVLDIMTMDSSNIAQNFIFERQPCPRDRVPVQIRSTAFSKLCFDASGSSIKLSPCNGEKSQKFVYKNAQFRMPKQHGDQCVQPNLSLRKCEDKDEVQDKDKMLVSDAKMMGRKISGYSITGCWEATRSGSVNLVSCTGKLDQHFLFDAHLLDQYSYLLPPGAVGAP